MAAKSKKRLSKIENKLLKLEKLELKDVFCSICHSILVEPVTLPCYHDFCLRCFNGSVENNALCCPLCRLRIGSWLRNATKQKNLVNVHLWDFIKFKFSKEVDIKTNGEDINLPEDTPRTRLSAPGEIRLEYENELKRLRAERLQLEQKHLQETELLIKKIQEEEEEAHRKFLEALKNDELLAQEMQNGEARSKRTTASESKICPRKQTLRGAVTKPKLKATRIDGYLSKVKATIVKDSPLLTDDNTSTDTSTPKESSKQCNNNGSPELIPSYGKAIKHYLDKKIKNSPGIWNKENGESVTEQKTDPKTPNSKELEHNDEKKAKSKHGVQSLLVSLPLPNPGLLQNKTKGNRSVETGSVDSMRQELCYFKPIEATSPTSFSVGKALPLKIPSVRAEKKPSSVPASAPSQEQYLEGLCRLRSLSKNLPSAFVVVLNSFKLTKGLVKCEANTRQRVKKSGVVNSDAASVLPNKRNAANNRNKPSVAQIDGISKPKPQKNLRRTRSMGSMSKDENETTPKKAKLKERKVASERRPYLRSDSKKSNAKKAWNSPSPIPESVNNNKINLVVKNLSSPLKNCDLKNLVHEQLRIEKLIEQEKKDFELARRVDAEWNGRRLRRPAPALPRADKKLRV